MKLNYEGNPGPVTKFPGAFDAKDPGKCGFVCMKSSTAKRDARHLATECIVPSL